ncbi:MAG: SRPBCC family protein [Acidobacteria bacterium]|nr:SRPBCC family protein [Acidobacteriota bacterium]
MLKKILLGLAGVIVVFCVVVAMQPAQFQVSRSATINAAPEKVHGLINDFHQWDGWSPWAKLDPSMKTTYEGPPSGSGAIYKWVGNDQVGEGMMTILESQARRLVKIKLDFIKPFASTSTTEFTVEESGSGSKVVWTMSGENNFLSKAMCLFMGGMDGMVGPDFEKGLAQMKTLAEK